MTYGLLVVEGQHDLEFCVRLLREHGLRRIGKASEVDGYWQSLIPTKFPPGDDEEDLWKRVPVPTFLKGSAHGLAVRVADGDNVGRALSDDIKALANLAGAPVAAGFVLDSDKAERGSAAERYDESVRGCDDALPWPGAPGQVAAGPPRCGAFVMPDNQAEGTLEDLLLACAAQSYPRLYDRAVAYVDHVEPSDVPTKRDRELFTKPAGHNKAIAASMGAILRPGMTIQTSIRHNRWVTAETVKLPLVKALDDFLVDLFDLA